MTFKSSKEPNTSYSKAKKIQVGEWVFHLNKLTITKGNDELSLEPKSVDLLNYLIENPNRVISKQELMDHVWQTVVSDNTISRSIVRLRRTLNDNPQDPIYIATVPRQGYRLIAPVHAIKSSNLQKKQQTWWVAASIILLLIVIVLGASYRPNGNTFNVPQLPMKLIPITSLIGDEIDPALSSDGNLLAFAHRESEDQALKIIVKNLVTNESFNITSGLKNAWLPAWSPDNSKLVYQNISLEYCHISIADVSDLENPIINQSILDCNVGVGSANVIWGGPDVLYFSEAASGNEPFAIYRYHLSSKNLNQITSPPNSGRGDYRLQLSPDGKWLAFIRNAVYWDQSELWLHAIESGETRRVATLPIRLRALTWLPDSLHLVVATPNKQLQSIHIDTGKATELTSEVLSLFHPSSGGDKLVASAGSFHHREIWRADGVFDTTVPTIETLSPFIVSTQSDYLPRFNPQNDSIAFISERSGLPQIWLLNEIAQFTQLTKFDQSYHFQSLNWSPDGRKLTTAANNRLIWLDVADRQVHRGPEELLTVAKPVWDQDNQRIYFSHKVGLEWQLFTYSTHTKTLVQVTQTGGYRSSPNQSGQSIFFSKLPQAGLWQFDLISGTENLIGDSLKAQHFNRDWLVSPSEKHFFFVNPENVSNIQRLDLEGGPSPPINLIQIDKDTIIDFDVSKTQEALLYTRTVLGDSDIVMLVPSG